MGKLSGLFKVSMEEKEGMGTGLAICNNMIPTMGTSQRGFVMVHVTQNQR
jgi:hypothetical protein